MKKILVVDDDDDVRAFLSNMLTKNNYSVLTASGGKQALGISKAEHPDLILLDILMPDMDGRDVLKELKKDQDTKGIPVIVLTGRGEQFDRVDGLRLGAEEYITKPSEVYPILRQISNILNKKDKNTQ